MRFFARTIRYGRGDCCCRHSGLLGRDRTMDDMNKNKTQTINHAIDKGASHRCKRQMVRQYLSGRHKSNDKATDRSLFKHLLITRFIGTNIMLTDATGVFGDFTRQQLGIIINQIANTIAAAGGGNQRLNQLNDGLIALIIIVCYQLS